jgi:hypothetical protein
MQQRLQLLLVKALTRLFHTDSAAACEHLTDTALDSHQPSRPLRHDQYEICGLTPFKVLHEHEKEFLLEHIFYQVDKFNPHISYQSPALPHQPSLYPCRD